ncbi:Glutathione transferase [Vibrio nigripulchritudo SFn27]|uniref:Glutathione S-transferase n=1 Tax=Vibrio nigripulchritudo TaxID=28173 RepID=A0A9P1NJN7_9VIBR|nr:glutathione S-transferase [Vibrio nigripulchritudo]CBJ93063.1 Putative Glutathione S-transferase [Vibrio nigripulchritudo]CCN85874.1 Glutathione transferase [Vibrio nigripulchritudo BLFn1]CCN91865.1 Glutathione transferase [Vibrio nigripulchritudo SFn27]CCN97670.1 Glutathione transferase [Vibrio nigripulchritudo ENn2]CCO43902.1 Glutathione transferase [Vibrio nigripulchritudo SFn135]
MLKLYWHPISGHAHRAHMLLSMLDLEFKLITIDLKAGEQQTPDFLALNPFGQIPVLVDGDIIISDSNAILVYLATAYDKGQRWLPDSPLLRAHIEQFLSLAANRLAGSISKLRAANLFNRRIDNKTLIEEAHKLLKQLQSHQSGRQWMVGKEPTIADLALYSYIKVAPEGGVSLTDYPALEVWLKRVESLPGFVAMSLSNVGLRG